MRHRVTRTFLGLSGALAAAIGASVLFFPHSFFATNHILLGSDPNLLSEIRAPGGLLLAAGAIMIAGAMLKSLLRSALFAAAIVFSMYGVSRLVSIALDGVPSSSIIGALVIELVIGMIASLLTARFAPTRSDS